MAECAKNENEEPKIALDEDSQDLQSIYSALAKARKSGQSEYGPKLAEDTETPGKAESAGAGVGDNVTSSGTVKSAGQSSAPPDSAKIPQRTRKQRHEALKQQALGRLRKDKEKTGAVTSGQDSDTTETECENRGKPKRQTKNVLTRMEVTTGPLSLLYRSVTERLKVKVWMRSAVSIRGICTGYVLAFDTHFNMVMADVDEVYKPAIKPTVKPTKKSKRKRKKKVRHSDVAAAEQGLDIAQEGEEGMEVTDALVDVPHLKEDVKLRQVDGAADTSSDSDTTAESDDDDDDDSESADEDEAALQARLDLLKQTYQALRTGETPMKDNPLLQLSGHRAAQPASTVKSASGKQGAATAVDISTAESAADDGDMKEQPTSSGHKVSQEPPTSPQQKSEVTVESEESKEILTSGNQRRSARLRQKSESDPDRQLSQSDSRSNRSKSRSRKSSSSETPVKTEQEWDECNTSMTEHDSGVNTENTKADAYTKPSGLGSPEQLVEAKVTIMSPMKAFPRKTARLETMISHLKVTPGKAPEANKTDEPNTAVEVECEPKQKSEMAESKQTTGDNSTHTIKPTDRKKDQTPEISETTKTKEKKKSKKSSEKKVSRREKKELKERKYKEKREAKEKETKLDKLNTRASRHKEEPECGEIDEDINNKPTDLGSRLRRIAEEDKKESQLKKSPKKRSETEKCPDVAPTDLRAKLKLMREAREKQRDKKTEERDKKRPSRLVQSQVVVCHAHSSKDNESDFTMSDSDDMLDMPQERRHRDRHHPVSDREADRGRRHLDSDRRDHQHHRERRQHILDRDLDDIRDRQEHRYHSEADRHRRRSLRVDRDSDRDTVGHNPERHRKTYGSGREEEERKKRKPPHRDVERTEGFHSSDMDSDTWSEIHDVRDRTQIRHQSNTTHSTKVSSALKARLGDSRRLVRTGYDSELTGQIRHETQREERQRRDDPKHRTEEQQKGNISVPEQSPCRLKKVKEQQNIKYDNRLSILQRLRGTPVGNAGMYQRHVNQMMIRGDNVVMVSIVP